MSIQQRAPRMVAEDRSALGRADNVREENRREHTVDLRDRTLAGQKPRSRSG
jgi:hypothetical protein